MSKPYLLSLSGAASYLGGLFRQLSIRDLLWLTLVVGLWFGWGVDRDVEYHNHERKLRQQMIDLQAQVEKLEERNTLLERALERCLESSGGPDQGSN